LSQSPPEPKSEPNSGKAVGNFLSLGGGTILARLVALLGTTYIARTLGPEGFGLVGLAITISSYISLGITAGVNAIGAREVARQPEKAANLAASVISFRLLLAFGAFVMIALLSLCLPKPTIFKIVVCLTGLSYFTIAIDTTWVHQGLEQNRRVGIAMILTEVINTGLLLLLVNKPNNVVLVPLAMFFGQLVSAIFLGSSIFFKPNFIGNLREGFQVFSLSKFYFISKLSRTLILTFDIILLGFIWGDQAVGLYSAPYRICYMLFALATAINFSYLPNFTRAVPLGVKTVSAVATHSLELSWVIIAPFVVGGIVVTHPLLDFLFGSAYLEGAAACRLLLVTTGLFAIRGTIQNILMVYDRLKLEMGIVLTVAIFNVILNLYLIPRHGLVGAALATTLSEGIILLFSGLVIYQLGISPDIKLLFRISLAAILMGIVLFFLGGDRLNFFANIILGSLTYIFSIVLLRAVPHDLSLYLNRFHSHFFKHAD
jgi:O-antigen/teichoic acid export membrane protein